MEKTSSFYFVRHEQNEMCLTVRMAFQSLCTTFFKAIKKLFFNVILFCFIFIKKQMHRLALRKAMKSESTVALAQVGIPLAMKIQVYLDLIRSY